MIGHLTEHEGHQGRVRAGFPLASVVSLVLPKRRSRMSSLIEIVREACYGLYHHWFRAALSMLGISWGIISVVVLLAYGNGFRGALDAGFRGAFSDGTVVVFPGQTSLQAGGERAGKRVRVTT